MDEADYRAHFLSDRQQRLRRWKMRLTVLGITAGIIASTVNATLAVLVHIAGHHHH